MFKKKSIENQSGKCIHLSNLTNNSNCILSIFNAFCEIVEINLIIDLIRSKSSKK